MTGKWASEGTIAGFTEDMAEIYPGQKIEIIEAFDVAHRGWECDSNGVLFTHEGVPELRFTDGVGIHDDLPNELEQKIHEYRQLIDDTEAVLTRYRSMGGK